MSDRPLYEQFRKRLEDLHERPLNFELQQLDVYTAENGWRIDDHQIALPPEPPGPPVAGGAWETAKQILQDYRFADPSIITGIFLPDTPLDQRVMLLRGRAFGLTFWLGARIGAVVDERRTTDAGEHQVWGYNYQTLEGHLERGQMEFTVWKRLDDGQVSFRIHAFSQADRIRNPVIRFGFWLFGRRVQLRFIENSLERMLYLVVDEMTHETPVHEQDPGPEVQSVRTNPKASRRFDGFFRRPFRGGSMQLPDTLKNPPIRNTDVRRWLVFTSFWGSISYLLSTTSMVIAARRRPVKIDTPTLGLGYALHVFTFVTGGSLASAASAIVRGKPTTDQSEEAISSGELQQKWPLQAVGGAVGSLVPFALAVASQHIAAKRTGREAIAKDVNWPVAGGAMVALSGLTALAVARIVAWVAEDAQSGE